jgi:hypothetical protein
MPQPWCITLHKTYTQLAEMNHELVLQIFCAHYGRHLPLSQACHAMLPGLSLYLLKSERELDHTTNQSLVGIELRTWTGPYYQSLEPYNLASSWTQTKHDLYYSPLHSFQIRHFLPFSILLCWSGDHSWGNLAKSSYKQNMEVTIFKHPSILFAAYWNSTQKCNDVFKHILKSRK